MCRPAARIRSRRRGGSWAGPTSDGGKGRRRTSRGRRSRWRRAGCCGSGGGGGASSGWTRCRPRRGADAWLSEHGGSVGAVVGGLDEEAAGLGAGAEGGGEVLGDAEGVVGAVGGGDGEVEAAAADLAHDDRGGRDDAVDDDGELLADQLAGEGGEGGAAGVVEGELHHEVAAGELAHRGAADRGGVEGGTRDDGEGAPADRGRGDGLVAHLDAGRQAQRGIGGGRLHVLLERGAVGGDQEAVLERRVIRRAPALLVHAHPAPDRALV